MGIEKNKILGKSKRLEMQKEKSELRLKSIQEKFRKVSQRIVKTEKKNDLKRKMILGNFMLEKIKTDPSIKSWLDKEIGLSNLVSAEKSLFGISEIPAE